MDSFAILSILAIFAVAVGRPRGKSTSPIFELNDANFEGMLKDKKVMIVDFYAPW